MSEHARNLIREEFKLSRANRYIEYHPIADRAFVGYDHRTTHEGLDYDFERYIPEVYAVTSRKWTLLCMFGCTRLLPCHHVLYIRRAEGRKSVVPLERLHERWRLEFVQFVAAKQDTVCRLQ